MTRRGGSSGRWRQRQNADPYVERADREGWRSRAVFKLEQIQKRERVLRPGMVCIDLGASPGSWSQYAARLVGPKGRIIAVDLLEMDSLAHVEFLQADFGASETVARLRDMLGESSPNLVMSDMAPNISGNRVIDQPRSIALAEDALLFCDDVLGPQGDFLVKLFQGEGFDDFVTSVRARFNKVRLIKPKASRPASREIYLLARTHRMV